MPLRRSNGSTGPSTPIPTLQLDTSPTHPQPHPKSDPSVEPPLDPPASPSDPLRRRVEVVSLVSSAQLLPLPALAMSSVLTLVTPLQLPDSKPTNSLLLPTTGSHSAISLLPPETKSPCYPSSTAATIFPCTSKVSVVDLPL